MLGLHQHHTPHAALLTLAGCHCCSGCTCRCQRWVSARAACTWECRHVTAAARAVCVLPPTSALCLLPGASSLLMQGSFALRTLIGVGVCLVVAAWCVDCRCGADAAGCCWQLGHRQHHQRLARQHSARQSVSGAAAPPRASRLKPAGGIWAHLLPHACCAGSQVRTGCDCQCSGCHTHTFVRVLQASRAGRSAAQAAGAAACPATKVSGLQ